MPWPLPPICLVLLVSFIWLLKKFVPETVEKLMLREDILGDTIAHVGTIWLVLFLLALLILPVSVTDDPERLHIQILALFALLAPAYLLFVAIVKIVIWRKYSGTEFMALLSLSPYVIGIPRETKSSRQDSHAPYG